jgi:hemolysin activation/secretion protein
MPIKLKIAVLLILNIFLCGTQGGYADSSSVPSSLDAGVLGRDNLKNLQYELKQNPDSVEIQVPSMNIDPDTENPQLSFVLKNVFFTGNTVYKNVQLEKYAEKYIGKEINFNDIQHITNEITALYYQNGYVTSLAYIPPQSVKDGNIKINIAENNVGNIKITNCKWIKPAYIKNNILKANDVESKKILNINDFKESIENLKQTPNLKANVYINKGEEPGTTDIILDIKDKIPLSFGVFNDNQGDDSTGLFRTGFILNNYNLTGYGDSLYASTTLSEGFTGVNTGYSFPIGPYGTKISIGYGISKIALGGEYQENDIRGISHGLFTTLSQPIYKKRNLIVNSDLTVDGRHTETTMYDLPYNKYDVRAVRLGLNASKFDNLGRWYTRLENSIGIPLLGASDNSIYGVGSSKFYKLNADVRRVQYLPFKTTGIFRSSCQYTPNALLSIEQIGAGGMSTVRGYDERLLMGDVGYNFSLELVRPIPYLPKITFPLLSEKFNTIDLKNRINFAVFYDQGYIQRIHDYRAGNHTNFLQSVGFGFKSYITNYLTVNTDFGIPLGRKRYAGQNDIRFHLYFNSLIN